MTPRNLQIFVKSVNQPVTTPPNSKMGKVVAYVWGIGEGSIITLPVDIELFSTEIAIYLERNDLERFISSQKISAACICLYMN